MRRHQRSRLLPRNGTPSLPRLDEEDESSDSDNSEEPACAIRDSVAAHREVSTVRPPRLDLSKLYESSPMADLQTTPDYDDGASEETVRGSPVGHCPDEEALSPPSPGDRLPEAFSPLGSCQKPGNIVPKTLSHQPLLADANKAAARTVNAIPATSFRPEQASKGAPTEVPRPKTRTRRFTLSSMTPITSASGDPILPTPEAAESQGAAAVVGDIAPQVEMASSPDGTPTVPCMTEPEPAKTHDPDPTTPKHDESACKGDASLGAPVLQHEAWAGPGDTAPTG